jgi:high-affinity iron transporter
VSYGIAEFTEAGLLPATPVVFDLSATLPESGLLGSLLVGLFGYTAAPTVLQVVGYLGYLIPVMLLFVAPSRPKVAPVAPAAIIVLLALGLTACAADGGDASSTPAPPADTTIDVTATEYQFDPSTLTAPAGSVAFRVTNNGTEEHEFEIFKGDQVVDEIEGLVPGLDRTLTVTLEAGDYTFACMLDGHDVAGMTGTLTITPS